MTGMDAIAGYYSSKILKMKKFFGLALVTLGLTIANSAVAQDKEETSTTQEIKSETKKAAHKTAAGAKKVGKATAKGAKKVGNKSAEVASKGKAVVTDEIHKDKVGPNGETIYIDNHAKYYWVDKKGTRHYVTETELKVKEQ
jgi:hypothetical protein